MCVPGNRTEDGLKRQVQLKTRFDLERAAADAGGWQSSVSWMIFGDCATSEFTGHASTITARCIRNQVKMSLPLLMSTCKCSTLTYYLARCREHVTSQTSYNSYHCST